MIRSEKPFRTLESATVHDILDQVRTRTRRSGSAYDVSAGNVRMEVREPEGAEALALSCAGIPRSLTGPRSREALLLALDHAMIASEKSAKILLIRGAASMLEDPNQFLGLPVVTTMIDHPDTYRIVAAGQWDLILCDLHEASEDTRGLVIPVLRAASHTQVPVLVIAPPVEDPFPEAEAYSLGVELYLRWPTDPLVVRAAVTSRIARSRNAQSDARAGFLTRNWMSSVYEWSAALAQRECEPLSAARITLRWDGAPSDAETAHTAALRVARYLRRSDFVAPLNDNELVALFPHTHVDGAATALSKVYHRISRSPVRTATGGTVTIDLHAQVMTCDPAGSLDACLAALEAPTCRTEINDFRPAGSSRSPFVPSKTLLLAEDDMMSARILQYRLEQAGYTVVHVADGESALAQAPDPKFAAIMLDVKMPRLDGFEVLQRIRSIRACRDRPVMMITSMSLEDDIVRGFELGADDYVLKPFSPNEVVARVNRLIRRVSA